MIIIIEKTFNVAIKRVTKAIDKEQITVYSSFLTPSVKSKFVLIDRDIIVDKLLDAHTYFGSFSYV